MNQGTQGYSLMKKTEGRKSRDTVPLSIPPRIGFTHVKSRIKKIRRREHGDCRYKMAGGFHTVATLRALIPRFATTEITPALR
jgi:hypothetical protein